MGCDLESATTRKTREEAEEDLRIARTCTTLARFYAYLVKTKQMSPGSVQKQGNGWRINIWLNGESYWGATRTTKEEADEDLRIAHIQSTQSDCYALLEDRKRAERKRARRNSLSDGEMQTPDQETSEDVSERERER